MYIKKVFESWEALVPRVLWQLYQIINTLKGELWLYGESVYTLCFRKEIPKYFDVATNLKQKDLFHALDLEYVALKKCTLYYHEDHWHVCHDDFSNHWIVPKYQIHVSFEKKQQLDIKKCFELDSLVWDFKNLYHYDLVHNAVQKQTTQWPVSISSETDLFLLFRKVRYLFQFKEWGIWALRKEIPPPKYTLSQRNNWAINWSLEWVRWMELQTPSLAIEYFRKCGALSWVFPELLEGYGICQNEFHLYDIYYHNLKACDIAQEPYIKMAALLHDIGKARAKRQVFAGDKRKNIFYNHENIGSKMAYKALKRFGFQENTVYALSKLVRMHMFHYTKEWTDSAVRRFMQKTQKDLKDLFKLRYADRLASGTKKGESQAIYHLEQRIKDIELEAKQLKVQDLKINGYDIMSLFSLKPGPRIGQVLDFLLEWVLKNPDKNNPNDLFYTAHIFLNSNLSKHETKKH